MTPERYEHLLTAVNGRAIQNGIFLVPLSQNLPLGENANDRIPSGPPGTIDLIIEPGNWEELVIYANQLGIDISLF